MKNILRKLFRISMPILIAALVLPAFFGCDNPIATSYSEQIVVGAFLYANSPIDSVVLHRTTPFGSYYDDLDYAVDSATVTITVDAVVHTLVHGLRKGRYVLPANELIVQGGKTYTLNITAPNRQTGGIHTITSVTTVPMPIHLTGIADSIRGKAFVFDSSNRLGFGYLVTATPTDPKDHRYLLSVTALDTNYGLLPIEIPVIDSNRVTRYSEVATGPSIAVTARLLQWYGPTLVTMYDIDTNFWDYQRQVTNFGGGDYQPTLNHISGGIGIFGSASRDTVSVFIKRKD